jgi:hypothetical protein
MQHCRALTAFLLLTTALPATATQVKIFRTRTQSAFLTGTLDGVSVGSLGTLRLADRAERVAEVAEPFLLSAAALADGWVVGTGNAGRVLKIDRQGQVSELFSTEEPEVFAVWADPSGTVYAGSSPKGKVYRYADGQATVFFDPGETYIWGLAGRPEGALLVATGTEGKLFTVDREGQGEVLFDADDTHLRVLQPLADGEVLVGTAGEGLVLLVDAQGGLRTLYDASQPEIVALAVAEDGTRFVAALASEASFVDLSKRQRRESTSASEQQGQESEQPTAQVTVVEQGADEVASGSRTPGFRGARSVVLKITPGGSVETLWRFENETVYAISWQRGRLWVGTGLEGKVYSYLGSKMVLEKDFDERQVVAMLSDAPGPAFATTDSAALYRSVEGTERQGVFTSSVLDAEQLARFGNLHWEGEAPQGTRAVFSFRSGLSSEPDQTWSPWSEARSGREVSLAEVPRGRYLQWRAELSSSNGMSPRIHSVELSYLQENLKPEISHFSVMDPGQVLVPTNFNPSNQVFEPAHPNRDGIFTSVEEAKNGKESTRLKTLWRKGYRTLRWRGEDPNGDDLRYDIYFRRDEDPNGWLSMKKDLDETHYSFDSTVLPDGLYRFRLRASDEPGNLPQETRVTEDVSESVVVDHGGAVLGEVRRGETGLRVTVEDALSPLREVVFSVDAGEWKPVEVVDGLLDGRSEEVIVEFPDGATLLLLRTTDAAFNIVTFDLSDRLR